jgi:hypothetical protein
MSLAKGRGLDGTRDGIIWLSCVGFVILGGCVLVVWRGAALMRLEVVVTDHTHHDKRSAGATNSDTTTNIDRYEVIGEK